jgi:hypothetical protein
MEGNAVKLAKFQLNESLKITPWRYKWSILKKIIEYYLWQS